MQDKNEQEEISWDKHMVESSSWHYWALIEVNFICPHLQGLQRLKTLSSALNSADGRDRSTVKMFNSSHIPACFVLNFGIKAPFYYGEDEEKKKKTTKPMSENFNSEAVFFFKGFLPKSFYLMDFTMSQMMLHTEFPRLYLWTTAYLFKN